ncbi:UNVERIFIED_CONTAM: hypothetical protein HDU68_007185 [Siphonaria sp. JEL0065]|nr:hypothetical protein HDU68_007185 [Siphonaria sp. JEL0065]
MATKAQTTQSAPASSVTSGKLDPLIASASKEVYSALNHIPISTLLAHKRSRQTSTSLPLVSVKQDTPLRDVLKLMAEKHLLAVPVYVESEDLKQKKFTGIVSIMDVLAWTVFQKLFDDLEALNTTAETGTQAKKFSDLDTEADVYFSTPVSNLVGYTAESSMSWTLHSTEPVSSLLQMITTPPYHRMLIVDVDEAVKNVTFDDEDVPHGSDGCVVMVTQTDLLHFLFTYRDTISPQSLSILLSSSIEKVERYAQKNIRNLRNFDNDPNQLSTLQGAGERATRIITVPSTYTALAAFRIMYLHRVSAVAVVSPTTGQMVANLSASDLRGITADMESLEALLLPVFEFLETKSRNRGVDAIKPDQLRSVTRDQVFEEAIKVLLESRIHRVWVEDEEEKPVGVLTMGDLLAYFVPVVEKSRDDE